ncbi:heme-degrading domain-containing protein [Agrobacterium sp. a22-2]|uniref:heme-degrading domain-containing protein n=1 Tax=Agrobacterium sp. a22-2 TaxID=2283840 RepID=UPI001444DCB0|nr:heme-degrading domain-containing protein [Agrobacterium sp. a22-2]NKN38454.1 heme-degrading domain-containing protein [Agrobacterium sp. a22-2]
MTATTISMETLIGQEETLVFSSFDEDTALEIGERLVEVATDQHAPVVINIRTADRLLFHAALPGSSPDNDHWARRKSNVTLRFHKSSMRVGESLRLKGRSIGPEIGLDPLDYASHGGSFPARVAGVGVVAAITVSGLASHEDHQMIVTVIEDYLAEN